jgi:hypothetical protein
MCTMLRRRRYGMLFDIKFTFYYYTKSGKGFIILNLIIYYIYNSDKIKV